MTIVARYPLVAATCVIVPLGLAGPFARAQTAVDFAALLAEAGVDLLALEMLQETRHAPLACEAARAVGLPVWLGVSCRLGAWCKNRLMKSAASVVLTSLGPSTYQTTYASAPRSLRPS